MHYFSLNAYGYYEMRENRDKVVIAREGSDKVYRGYYVAFAEAC